MTGSFDIDCLDEFRRSLEDCRRLYVHQAGRCGREYPHVTRKTPQQFVQWMHDLHKGVVLKTYLTVATADRRWGPAEQRLAQILMQHVWAQDLEGEALREAVRGLNDRAVKLKWSNLVRPFAEIGPLREHAAELEGIVMRMANLVAKADGTVTPTETRFLRSLQQELESHLFRLPLDGTETRPPGQRRGQHAVAQLAEEVPQVQQACDLHSDSPPEPEVTPEQRRAAALAELDGLIGLETIKQEIHTLANYLQMQQHREAHGLPRTPLSLHMVFQGNPGTGKTTVARIVGELLGAMGIVARGHLVETDRSGLVAEYAGQTGPKTNKKIDEALDGVLFIDEAYSLVAEQGEDAFGQEALQALLKRMEDNRDRLVVILAGYPEPMRRLLRSNPGLSSRFSRTLTFEDYPPADLCRIYERLCQANHYRLVPGVRSRLLLGYRWLYDHRDEHFGNGRTVRNHFEDAIRRLSNRIADIVPLTRQVLTTFHSDDIGMSEIPAEVWRYWFPEFRISATCRACQRSATVSHRLLGKRVKCHSCQTAFVIDWAEPIVDWSVRPADEPKRTRSKPDPS